MYGMDMSDDDLSNDDARGAAIRVREELAKRGISRETLAVKAGISLSTLEKALSSRHRLTLSTLVRLEKALQMSLRPFAAVADTAPESMGAYAA